MEERKFAVTRTRYENVLTTEAHIQLQNQQGHAKTESTGSLEQRH